MTQQENRKPFIYYLKSKLYFGKYKGELVSKIVEADPDYLKYIINNTDIQFADQVHKAIFPDYYNKKQPAATQDDNNDITYNDPGDLLTAAEEAKCNDIMDDIIGGMII